MLQNKLKVIRGNWNVFRKLDKLFKLNFFYLQFQNSYKRKGDKDVKKKKRERGILVGVSMQRGYKQ